MEVHEERELSLLVEPIEPHLVLEPFGLLLKSLRLEVAVDSEAVDLGLLVKAFTLLNLKVD